MASTAEWIDQSIGESEVTATTSRKGGYTRDSGQSPAHHSGGWSLRRKLIMILALMWLGMIAIVFSMAWQGRASMVAEREHALVDVVGMVTTQLQGFAEEVKSGELTLEQAQRRALRRVAAMRFGQNRGNYVFVVDDKHRVVYHPRREPGIDMAGYTDPAGTLIYQKFVETGVQSGSGFVKYVAQRSKDGPFLEKRSYVERFEPWQWNVSAGVYMTDIQTAFYKRLTQYALALILVGGLLTLAFGILGRSIYRTLGGEPRDAQAVVERIAAGDLTPDANSQKANHGLMSAIERMRHDLGETVARIRQSSEAIDNGAREIASGNTDLSSRTEEQAASLEETAASMEQITATVRQSAENAGQASSLSNETTSSVTTGQAVIGRVVSTMQDINASSHEISDIITLIDGIAFQTNLLALNAAVEAARAGEHGRGFAVVASEVRQLARRSAEAAQNIKTLIERSVSQVSEGTDLVGEAENAMNDIHQSAERVNSLLADISNATQEQTSGIEQINEAITQIDQVTQQNAALVEQAAAAASLLEERAGELNSAVSGFRVAGQAI